MIILYIPAKCMVAFKRSVKDNCHLGLASMQEYFSAVWEETYCLSTVQWPCPILQRNKKSAWLRRTTQSLDSGTYRQKLVAGLNRPDIRPTFVYMSYYRLSIVVRCTDVVGHWPRILGCAKFHGHAANT